jgi:hypothetical protein
VSGKLVIPGEKERDPAKVWWVEVLRWCALAVFVAVPVFAYFAQPWAGRVVWTMVVAALPLFIVLVGYHRWRRICPLAFFAQIPVRARWPGTRRASAWTESNYYLITFAIFFVSLWLRLIATNGDGQAIAGFFILLSGAAMLFGSLFTGKTWCNYICPVSFVEKIYTEPHGLRETENSQCEKCSACKKFCPDINEENGYWKEISLPAKRFVYFAFPGTVFAFYFYYYLQAGSWEYYFGGRWTNEPHLIRTAFFPGQDPGTAGFFFLPAVPRAVAAALTLAAFALLSFAVFVLLERILGRWLLKRERQPDAQRTRHLAFSIAAFTAFVIFYSFAGQPSLRKLTMVPALQLASIVVVLTATLFLVRRLRRTPKDFAEETLARSILKRWEWTDAKPRDLREAFLIHTIRTRESARESARVVEAYKDSVREVLANGFVTRDDVQLLEHLRGQLQIKKSDHEKVMAALAEEDRAVLSDPAQQITAEKRLQLGTYAQALKKHLEKVIAAKGDAGDKFIVRLRSEYGVTRKEHLAVLDDLLGGDSAMAAQLAAALRTIERAELTIKALEQNPSSTHAFLATLLVRRRAQAIESLMHGLTFNLPDENSQALRLALGSTDEPLRDATIDQMLRSTLSAAIAERLLNTYRETKLAESSIATLTEMLSMRLRSVDPYVRAVSLYALAERGAANERVLDELSKDDHELVRETANDLTNSKQPRECSIVARMIALSSTPIFSNLEPEGLAELARASTVEEFAPETDLCQQGDAGDDVFIILAGEVDAIAKNEQGETSVNRERTGGFIGELAVLDPAPRSAGLRAGPSGARVLRLDGQEFRNTLNAEPAIAAQVIRTLAQRLRRVTKD